MSTVCLMWSANQICWAFTEQRKYVLRAQTRLAAGDQGNEKTRTFFPASLCPLPPHPFPESRCFSPWWCLLQSNLIWSDWRHFVLVEDRQLDYLIFMCLRALVCRACARVCTRMHVLNASSFLTSLFTLLLLFYFSSLLPPPSLFFVCVHHFSSHSSNQLCRQLYATHLHFTPRLVLIVAIRALAASDFFFFSFSSLSLSGYSGFPIHPLGCLEVDFCSSFSEVGLNLGRIVYLRIFDVSFVIRFIPAFIPSFPPPSPPFFFFFLVCVCVFVCVFFFWRILIIASNSLRQALLLFLSRQSRALFLPSASWHLTDKDKLV